LFAGITRSTLLIHVLTPESQAILLILRRLARAGAIQLNPEPLERTHSRGCSPNALYALLA
jgi:hypothetical protein